MPREVDHASRRAGIHAAVLSMAAENGFKDVTVRAVAARIGTSTSTVTYYTNGRDELIGEAVRLEIERQRAHVNTLLANKDRRKAVRDLVEWAVTGASAEEYRIWLAIILGARSEPTVNYWLQGFNSWWDEQLGKLVRGLRPKPTARPSTVIDTVNVLVNGLVLTEVDDNHKASWTRARRLKVVDTVLYPLGL
jgi:AcrR family transcriptional regulator